MRRISRNTHLAAVVCVAVSFTFAQQSPPSSSASSPVHVVRIVVGYSSGLSGYYGETTVEARSMRSVSHCPKGSPAEVLQRQRIPSRAEKCSPITNDWQGLQELFDSRMLAAFTGRTSCPACVDQPENWVWLYLSDGTNKFVLYNPSNPGTEVGALLKRINAISLECIRRYSSK